MRQHAVERNSIELAALKLAQNVRMAVTEFNHSENKTGKTALTLLLMADILTYTGFGGILALYAYRNFGVKPAIAAPIDQDLTAVVAEPTQKPKIAYAVIPTSTPIPAPTETPTKVINTKPATPRPADKIPAVSEKIIATIPNAETQGRVQSLPLNCEVTDVDYMARLLGYKNVTADQIMAVLAKAGDDGDPNHGFVGDPKAPAGSIGPKGFGVFLAPLAEKGLKPLGIEAVVKNGANLADISTEIRKGNPVEVIAIWGLPDPEGFEPVSWKTKTGEVVNTFRWEHSYVVVGETQGKFLVYNSQPTVSHPMYEWVAKDEFAQSWNAMGAQMMTIKPKSKN